ncbi:MAG: D-alanyl-D-alanine carboxypeptidase, partial [Pseudomonadales bacterium]
MDGSAPLVSLNPRVARNPASTAKILTTYTALETLTPRYVWPTEVYLEGELRDGVLHGDLGIKGYGDP